jgi:hypothetical protein
MAEARSISEALAPLIFQGSIPLKTIALIGEIITIDARLRDYEQGPTKRTTGDELGAFLESYDALLQRVRSAVAEFMRTQDRSALMNFLPEIRDNLAALY